MSAAAFTGLVIGALVGALVAAVVLTLAAPARSAQSPPSQRPPAPAFDPAAAAARRHREAAEARLWALSCADPDAARDAIRQRISELYPKFAGSLIDSNDLDEIRLLTERHKALMGR